jgi:F0F1-type ATP synthase delta subunit
VLKDLLPEKVYATLKKDRGMILQKLVNLEQELQRLRVFEVTLAFEPTVSFLEKLFLWVRENIGQGIILKLEKDESIIGGAIVSFEGKYLDLSIKSKLEELNKKRNMT